jgi:hypothetical protein
MGVGCMPLLDCEPSLAHVTPPGTPSVIFNLRHALRYRTAPQSGDSDAPINRPRKPHPTFEREKA